MKKAIYCLFYVLYNFVSSQSNECSLLNGQRGTCVEIKSCPVAIEQIKRRQRPETCRFDRSVPIVCCPDNGQPKFGEKARQKCEEIKKLHNVTFDPYVIGGVDARAFEYTHMAALGYGDQNDIQWNCGGSLISDRHILTAAHCLESLSFGPLRWARLGDLDLKKEIKNEKPQNFEVISRIRHPNNAPPQKYNDIAILVLERPVVYNMYVAPACLHIDEILTDKRLLATGWGLVENGGEQSDHLQEVQLELFTKDECTKAYSSSRRNLNDGIIDSQLCAGGRTQSKDTCQGDSGGPLQYQNYQKVGVGYRGYTVCGVVSFGKICGVIKNPGVYTRVSSYVPWIESIVWPN